MRRVLALLALSFGIAVAASVGTGDRLPALELRDWDGKPVSLEQFAGKPLVIDFWASWCGACKAALPALDAVARRQREHGVVVVAINVDRNRKAADGWLTITDRKKDIIIRGGENVSAAEVEEILVRMPDVAEVAVVAAPDDRLGEIGCAHFRMLNSAPAPDLPAIRSALESAGLAKQKWPELVREVPDFPRTPSGKVQKFVLRQRLREESGQ